MKQAPIAKQPAALAMTTVASFLFIVSILFTLLQFSINDRSWFEREYQKLDLESSISIPNDEITDALMRLVDYMEGRVDSIQLIVRENGLFVDMYNEREMAHMVDVRALYQAWRGVRTWGAAVAFALIFGAFFLNKKEIWSNFSRGFLQASAVFFLLVALIGAFALIDFTVLWNGFHYLFFDNDLWLLSPARDRMIRICPERLFSDIVARFGLNFLLSLAVLLAAAGSIYFVHKPRHAHER